VLMADEAKPPSVWTNPNHVDGDASRRVAEASLRGNDLRRKAASGLALGTFLIEFPCPETVSAMALAGFDFVVLDMEHSSLDFQQLDRLIAAAQVAGIPAIVRPWSNDPALIGKILDLGANGVMASHVDTAEKARNVVSAARFTPYGERGFSPLTKYDFSKNPLKELSQAAYVIVQVEGAAGIQNVESIANVSGVDSIFIGPYDLSLSLGLQPGGAEVYKEAAGIAERITSSVSLGIYVDDPQVSAHWSEIGFAVQCVSFDGRMFADGARRITQNIKRPRGVE